MFRIDLMVFNHLSMADLTVLQILTQVSHMYLSIICEAS